MAPPSYKDLIARLPRTFGPSLNDQFRQWEFLFPAEQRQIKAQLDWLASLPPEELQSLFSPITQIEAKMDLPRWQADKPGLSIQDVGILARSPHYPQWRVEVEKVFGRIDDAVSSSSLLRNWTRLIICTLPAGLPIDGKPLWEDLAGKGNWISLPAPYIKLQPLLASALLKRKLPAGLESEEGSWVIECGSSLSAIAEPAGAVAVSWSALESMRREFLSRLNTIRRDLKSADQTNEELKRLDLHRYLTPAINNRPRVREFVRSILLSGNGSLVFNNSFVQWGSSECLRRAQPQVLFAGFGMRQKLKPFSSVVLFEDQNISNPVPDDVDPAGSLIDAHFLSQYIQLSAEGLSPYRGRTLTILAVEDLDRILLTGCKTAPPGGKDLAPFLLEWLSQSA